MNNNSFEQKKFYTINEQDNNEIDKSLDTCIEMHDKKDNLI